MASPPRTTRGRTPLTRERILRAALAIIDERGLRALTMRGLAAELGVEAMSLYWHVKGKPAVLDGVVEMLLDEMPVDRSPELGWREGLEHFARCFRRVALDHPDAFPLFAARPIAAYIAGRDLAEVGLARLVEAGLPPVDAALAQRSVIRWVLGFSLSEQAGRGELARAPQLAAEAHLPEDGYPLVTGALTAIAGDQEGAVLFEYGLRLVLDGIEVAISSRRQG